MGNNFCTIILNDAAAVQTSNNAAVHQSITSWESDLEIHNSLFDLITTNYFSQVKRVAGCSTICDLAFFCVLLSAEVVIIIKGKEYCMTKTFLLPFLLDV